MRFFLIFTIFLPVFLSAQHFTLNPKYLKPQPNPMAIAIFQDYERFMNKLYKKSLDDKLKIVNNYINNINSIDDSPHSQIVDFWSTRGEFLSKGGGDCEDYAIAKYYTLKDMGLQANNMCLILVKEKYSKMHHAVLGYWKNPNSQPLILDNLSFRVLPLDKRVDLKPLSCVNELGTFKINKNGTKSKINGTFSSYNSMLKRAKTEKLWK